MLISRIFSAVAMLAVFLSSMFLFSGRYFSFVIYITSILALYEWTKLLYFKSYEKKIFLFVGTWGDQVPIDRAVNHFGDD